MISFFTEENGKLLLHLAFTRIITGLNEICPDKSKKEPAKFYNYRIKIKLKSDKQLKNYG